MKPTREAFYSNVMRCYKDGTQILVSELNDGSAAVLGAAAIAWRIK